MPGHNYRVEDNQYRSSSSRGWSWCWIWAFRQKLVTLAFLRDAKISKVRANTRLKHRKQLFLGLGYNG